MGHTPGMTSPAASAPYTWDDFVALDEDDPRELIDGQLIEVEVPTDVHEYIVWRLCAFLAAWAVPRKAGIGFASGYKVRITDRRGVMPDVQFYRAGNRAAGRTRLGLVSGHPDLAVEIVSDSSARYDRMTKLAFYASIGVPEYWIVDSGHADAREAGAPGGSLPRGRGQRGRRRVPPRLLRRARISRLASSGPSRSCDADYRRTRSFPAASTIPFTRTVLQCSLARHHLSSHLYPRASAASRRAPIRRVSESYCRTGG